MINYINPILADVFFSGAFALQKKYQQKTDTSIASGIKFNIISAVSVFPLLLCACLFKPQVSAYSLLMAFFASAVVFAYTLASFLIIKSGGLAMYTLFLMTGGMIVPFVWGVCFLDESISLMQIGGILLISASIVLSSAGNKKSGLGIIALCILVFFLNGASSVIAKLHQTQTHYLVIGTYDYMFWSNVFRIIMSFLLLPLAKGNKNTRTSSGAIVIVIIAAISNTLASFFNLMGAVSLPATVLFPFVTGGTMVFSFFMEVIFFKERLTLKKLLPVIISFAGTLMFL